MNFMRSRENLLIIDCESLEIVISRDFSCTPGARYRNEGKFSGEEFRDDILEVKYNKCVSNGEKLVINFDGGYGYSTVFLEEAFGGFIRKGYSLEEFLSVVYFVSDEEVKLIDDIMEYMKDAEVYKLRRLDKIL